MRRGLPLSVLITGIVLALTTATTAAVGWSGLQGAHQTADDLWHQLADHLAHRTTAEALRFLHDAEPHARISAELIEAERIDPSDRQGFLAYLEDSMDAYPSFTWVSWGHAETGEFVGVYRVGAEQPLHRTTRTQQDGGTRYVVEARLRKGWTVIEDHLGLRRYDPRERPWFLGASGLPRGQGTWIEPYLFHNRDQPGVSYAVPARGDDDALIGVYCVDFETAPLSRFLATLRVGRTGRVFVVASDGRVIGHPDGKLVRLTGDGPGFWPAAEHPDPMLSGAFSAWRAQGDPTAPFSFGEYLAVASPFPASSGIPWVVLTVVPREELLGHAEHQARRALGFGAASALLVVGLGLALSGAVSRSVAALREDLLRTARLDLTDDRSAALGRSRVRELAEMGQAIGAMKQGLRAFSRYVPHQLVRQLLASGHEAKLGAERRELTILFSDIAGFTTVVESTPPDRVLAALSSYLDGMNEAIGSTGGTVCQYLGDGILAFWGAPDDLADHAARACRGALAMAAHADRLLAEAEAADRPRLPTRIGLDTGEAMVGNIGASDRFNYGVLGDTVNTAARLEELNKTYGTTIVVGDRTAELAGDAFLFRPIDRVRPRGKRRLVAVHELVGERARTEPDRIAAVSQWSEAMQLYFDARFADALPRFETFRAQHPDDGPARAMIARCERYLAQPPPEGWDGVYVAPDLARVHSGTPPERR